MGDCLRTWDALSPKERAEARMARLELLQIHVDETTGGITGGFEGGLLSGNWKDEESRKKPSQK